MRRRARERAGSFVAEGEDLLQAADAAGWTPVERYCAAGSGLEGVEVDEEALTRASGLASGTRTLAVYEERWAATAAGPLCLYLHGVHDPGNVGTALRGAEAFAASSVALGAGSADPFSPKAVRASMGAVFGVPLARVDEIGELPGEKIALIPGQGIPLHELEPSGQVSLMVGSEREGLPPAAVDQAGQIAHIPIHSSSLNAAMAATVALYHLANRMARQ